MERWILLRGLVREQRHWGSFPALLAAALPDARLYTPDLPGNGSRYRETSPASVRQMVEACRLQLQQAGVAPPYSLLALSLGGMVALTWADLYPQELRRCVLVNTSMRPYSPFYQRLRWQNYGAIVRQLLSGGRQAQEQLILRLTSRSGDAPGRAALVQQWLGYQQEYPVARRNALRQLWAAARFRAPARRPALPVLLIASAGDQLVDHRCTLELARAWQTSARLHPTAGHDLPLDAGAWLAQQIADWVAASKAA
ncbi:alpha/beta fold hydrolase [Pseudoduganella danionis]|uniref:Alpha/beta fold hydrolase n=1 Tax=Pseudoduganella danionis TaxID=1890295 RepID=A0ABW9SIC1_9BURK|nr:alpha/beta hydrolase [Pseudoduganella danionis]MTW31281.1 alpha/beta fold hydrolase [Pseudoduganella danionis]